MSLLRKRSSGIVLKLQRYLNAVFIVEYLVVISSGYSICSFILRGICNNSFSRGGVRKGNDVVTQQSEARTPARAYVVRTREDGDANDVVTGIFLLHAEPVYTLIDPGSLHSYVNTKLVELGSLKSESSRVSIVVSSPLGQSVLVDQVCRRCLLMIQNMTFPVDLLIMSLGDFDVILGMDWLSKYGVVLDCCRRSLLFRVKVVIRLR
nr:unnamed protein product [Gossypium raimondii]